mmetsp:Transcript_9530/g.18323  ORF Transcript_9530/g.18323 Transcript_9530/m.18323 type:complete len:552 (-) Transcript_9530:1754-3409(-)
MKLSTSTTIWVVVVLVLILCHTTTAQECNARTGACDTHERCPVWAEEGECEASASYMREHCPGSCSSSAGIAQHRRREVSQSDDEESDEDDEPPCEDQIERCSVWAELGECEANPDDMHEYCPYSCGICDGSDDDDEEEEEDALCRDQHDKCPVWAKMGECDKNPTYMHAHCASSCDTCPERKETKPKTPEPASKHQDVDLMKATKVFGEMQKAEGGEKVATLARIQSTLDYMKSEDVTRLPDHVKVSCLNRQELCTFWAVIGECEKNKAYMATNCAPACHTCHMIDMKTRCPPSPEGTPAALEPDDLDKMFRRIISTAPGNQTNTSTNPDIPPYTVHVHSSPDDNGGPWVVTFENFITKEEAKELIWHGHEEGYKRSEDVGGLKFDGSVDSKNSTGRTSENAWCSSHKGCRQKQVPTRIHDRISAVTGIPADNSEDLQLLKYEVGQFYRTHHDYIDHQKDRNCGPRILTFFLYLSDVEEGGGTDFPDLGITVQPKLGRAVLWPSVRNESPLRVDKRMRHQALPVIQGTKFAANAWIHMYDYVTAQKDGCN